MVAAFQYTVKTVYNKADVGFKLFPYDMDFVINDSFYNMWFAKIKKMT